jgi:hypothetical protein
MSLLYGKLLGEVDITSTSDTFILTRAGVAGSPFTINLDQGKYADVRLLATNAVQYGLKFWLNQKDGANNYDVAVSDTTGIVQIAGDANFSITWTDTTLRDVLGFSGDLAGNNTFTGATQHKYGFYPERPYWWYDLDQSEIEAAITVSHSGDMTSDFFYERTTGVLEYQWRVSTEQEELRTFWDDIVRQHKSFNLYRNRADNTAYHRSTNTDGYDRWRLSETTRGFTGAYPYRPFAEWRRFAWNLRQDTKNTNYKVY